MLAIAALLLGGFGNAWAQTAATGTIDGVVTDNTGGVLPGVTVTVRNLDTNVTRDLVTDSQGHYRAVALPPGMYEVKATLSGFQAEPVTNIAVLVGQTAPVDVKMRPSSVSESVTVTADASLAETKRPGVSNVIGQEAIENLPVTGRRWDNFVLLSPGVTNDSNFGLVSYRGISGLYNNNMVDGVDNNQAFFSEARGRTRIAYSISEASIKEFQVGVSNMSAEFGRAGGGTVNAVTKSGSNHMSGEGFYYVRTDELQAKNPLINLPGGGKPNENRQQFGAALGGPIKENKAFFFGSYDQQYRSFPIYANYNSATFPTGACTAPAANCSSTLAFFSSLNALTPRKGNNKVFLGKVDYVLNPSNTLSLSINSHRWNSPNGIQTQPIVTVAESMNGTDKVQTDFFVGSLTTLLGPRMVNEFRTQIGRDYEEQEPNSQGPGTTVTGGINFGMPNFLPRPAYPHEKRFQFLDSVTYFTGAHSIKAGVDINYVQEQLINLFNGGGVYAYSNLSAIANDCPIGSVGCVPAQTGTTTSRHYNTYTQAFDLNGLNGKLNFNTWQTAFYVQDTWRLNDQLVANLGLRYDYQSLPEPGSVTVDGVDFNGNPALPLTTSFHQDKNNFGPRLGLTYDMGGRHDMVFRTNYGVFYGLTSNSAVANALTNNGVNQATFTFNPTTAGAPQYPNVYTTVPTINSARTINELDPNLERPTIQMFDATVDRRVWNNATVSVSYLYSHASHLPIFRDINLNPANSQVTYVLDGQNVGTFPFYRGARPDTNYGAIIMLDSSIVTSNYNALVLQMNKAFSDGLSFNAHYTLSNSKDNGQESTTFFSNFSEMYDPLNGGTGPDGESPSSFDRRHRFVGSGYWRATRFWDIGVSGVLTLESGLPISQNISGSVTGTGATSTGSTNGTGGAFFAPWLGRNSARQTGRQTFDLRLSKQFGLKGGAKAEVLVDIFNLFNHVNYTSASATAFGVTSATYDAAANLTTVVLNHNSGFLVPSAVGNTLYGMREGQIGFKILW